MHRQLAADRFPPVTGPRSWRDRRVSLNTPRPAERHKGAGQKKKASWQLIGVCTGPTSVQLLKPTFVKMDDVTYGVSKVVLPQMIFGQYKMWSVDSQTFHTKNSSSMNDTRWNQCCATSFFPRTEIGDWKISKHWIESVATTEKQKHQSVGQKCISPGQKCVSTHASKTTNKNKTKTQQKRRWSPTLGRRLAIRLPVHRTSLAGNLSVTSWVVMPARLALCDLGAPGWGEPWFPHSAVLLYSHLGMAMSVMFVFSVLPLLHLPYQYKRWYKDITLTHCRCYITGLPATFPLLGLFCAVCFGLFCLCVFSLVWFCFSVFVMWRNCDGILDYVSVHHQFTFAATQ